MTHADLAVCVLSVLADDHRGAALRDDPGAHVAALVLACDGEYDDCVPVLAVLWAMESRFSFSPGSRHAFGPVQVLEVPGMTPTAREMRDDPVAGLRAGWAVWQAKSRRLFKGTAVPLNSASRYSARLNSVARAYNGHPRYRDRYGRTFARMFGVVAKCRQDNTEVER